MREMLLEWTRIGGLVVSFAILAKLTHMLVLGAVRAWRAWALALHHARRAAAERRGEPFTR